MSATNDFEWAGPAGEPATGGCCTADQTDPASCGDGTADRC